MTNPQKTNSIIRDLCVFCVLLFLIKTASHRTISFIALHKNSIIHELDRTFTDHLYTAQKQAHQLKELLEASPTPVQDAHIKQLSDIAQKLSAIEEKYTNNSPGLALLGPLGTTAIVLKEQDLEKKLLKTALDLCTLAYASCNSPSPISLADSSKKLSLDAINNATHTALAQIMKKS